MRIARIGTAAVLVLGVAALAPASEAASPHQVDPAFVTPPLNSDFAPWTCQQNGRQIVCEGGVQETYDDTTGIPCGGGEIHVVGAQKVDLRRWHDLQGRALKTVLHTAYDDHLSLSTEPGTPEAVLYAHWQKHYVYPVPGDQSQRVLRETGAILRVRSASGGTLIQDTGFVEYVPNEEDEGVAVMHGVHDRFLGDDLDQVICDDLIRATAAAPQ